MLRQRGSVEGCKVVGISAPALFGMSRFYGLAEAIAGLGDAMLPPGGLGSGSVSDRLTEGTKGHV